MTRQHPLLLFILLFCKLSLTSAQSLLVTVDNKIIAPGDTIQLSYFLEGGEEDFKDFKTADWPGFKMTGGPYQSQSSSQNIVNGKIHQSKRIQIIYKLKVKKEGTFVIRPAQVTTAEGHKIYSDPLTIKAVAGYQKKAVNPDAFPHIPATTDIFSDDWQSQDLYEMLNRSDLFPAHLKLSQANRKYILIVGWPYKVSSIRFIKSLMWEAAATLHQRKGLQPVDSFMEDDIPRYYYALNDTLGIRLLLNGVIAKGGTENKSAVILSPMEGWSVRKETYAFNNEQTTWSLIYKLTKNGAFPGIKSRDKTRAIQMQFRFSDKSKLACLAKWGRNNNYRVVATDTANSKLSYYTASFLKTTELTEDAIYETINILRLQGREQGCEATFYGLELVDRKHE